MEGEYVAFRGHFLFFFSLNHLKALKLYSFENNLNTIRHMCQNDLSITLTLLRLSCDNTGFTETYNTTVSKAIISYRVKAKTGSLRGCPYCYIGSRRLMSPAKVFSGTFFLILRFFMAALFRLNFFTLQLKKKEFTFVTLKPFESSRVSVSKKFFLHSHDCAVGSSPTFVFTVLFQK